MINLLSIIILISYGPFENIKKNSTPLNQTKDVLETGWYYLTDKENGIEKKIKGEYYFIDRNPIATVDNFTNLNITQSNNGDYLLVIELDIEGAINWSKATRKSIGGRLALIIDNELFYTPKIKSEITQGVTALNRGDLTEDELKLIKNKIEKEKTNTGRNTK